MILGIQLRPMMLKQLRTIKTEGRVDKVGIISKREILQEIEVIKDFGCYPKSISSY